MASAARRSFEARTMREAVSKVEALQRSKTQGISLEDVERGVAQATRALTALAHDDGHICFELEADATIPSERSAIVLATDPAAGLIAPKPWESFWAFPPIPSIVFPRSSELFLTS